LSVQDESEEWVREAIFKIRLVTRGLERWKLFGHVMSNAVCS